MKCPKCGSDCVTNRWDHNESYPIYYTCWDCKYEWNDGKNEVTKMEIYEIDSENLNNSGEKGKTTVKVVCVSDVLNVLEIIVKNIKNFRIDLVLNEIEYIKRMLK